MKYICRLCNSKYGDYDDISYHLVEYHNINADTVKFRFFDLVSLVQTFEDIQEFEKIIEKHLSKYGLNSFTIIDFEFRNNSIWIEVVFRGKYKEIGEFLDRLKEDKWFVKIEGEGYFEYNYTDVYGVLVSIIADFERIREDIEAVKREGV